MSTGERIRLARNKKRLSQIELANLTGIDNNTISRWERDALSIKGENLSKLAAALDTSVAYLMGESDDPRRHQAGLSESAEGEARESAGNPPMSEDAARRRQQLRNIDGESGELQASQDLDELIRELAGINPDLIVNFRTTKQHWKDLPFETKKKIAQGMMFVLGLAELSEEDGFKTPKSDEDL